MIATNGTTTLTGIWKNGQSILGSQVQREAEITERIDRK